MTTPELTKAAEALATATADVLLAIENLPTTDAGPLNGAIAVKRWPAGSLHMWTYTSFDEALATLTSKNHTLDVVDMPGRLAHLTDRTGEMVILVGLLPNGEVLEGP